MISYSVSYRPLSISEQLRFFELFSRVCFFGLDSFFVDYDIDSCISAPDVFWFFFTDYEWREIRYFYSVLVSSAVD